MEKGIACQRAIGAAWIAAAVFAACDGDDERLVDASADIGGDAGSVVDCCCTPNPDPRCRNEDLVCSCGCTTVGDACDAGGCYYTLDGIYCFEAGTKQVGEPCGAAAECVVGVQCLDNGGMFCWQVCTADDDCEKGKCVDTELGFSVCVPQTEE